MPRTAGTFASDQDDRWTGQGGDSGFHSRDGRDAGSRPFWDGPERKVVTMMRKPDVSHLVAAVPGTPGPESVVTERPPLALRVALQALATCVVSTAHLLWRRRLHLPTGHMGMRLRFADGTSAPVYRESVAGRGATRDPCVLVVEFRLRAVRGFGHALFRWESLLNTPLFAGFPGFVSKLWLAHDERGRYRGVYEWDGAERAAAYARALWWVLALVSVRGSVHYVVLPGLRRDELLARPDLLGTAEVDAAAWWRLAAVL
jgi:hypothetical protein